MKDNLREKLGLTLVSSAREAAPRTVESLAALVFDGGAGVLQLREKNLPDRDFCASAQRLSHFCRERGALLIINDRLDVALISGADGLHLGQHDLPASEARRFWPAEKILGVSVGTRAEAEKALADGADYLGIGTVFPTQSKADAEEVALSELRAIVALGAPTVAIGGLTRENCGQVWSLGVTGLALISALNRADDPRGYARALLAARGEASKN